MKYPDDIWKQITNANCVETALQLGLDLDEKKSDKKAIKVKGFGGLFLWRDGSGYYHHSNNERGNELATHLHIISRDKITSVNDLENRYSMIKIKLENYKKEISELKKDNLELKSILGKAQFYFANHDKTLDSMGQAKLSSAKQSLDNIGINTVEDIKDILYKFRKQTSKISEISKENERLISLESQYSRILKTYGNITEEKYFKNLLVNQNDNDKNILIDKI